MRGLSWYQDLTPSVENSKIDPRQYPDGVEISAKVAPIKTITRRLSIYSLCCHKDLIVVGELLRFYQKRIQDSLEHGEVLRLNARCSYCNAPLEGVLILIDVIND